jgi:hypothetical protein
MAKSVNFEVIQGDSFSIDFTYTNEDGSPVVLDGYSVIFSVRNEPGGKVLCATCTIGDGVTITNSSQGKFKVTVSGTKSKKFTLPRAHYQCQIYTTDENKNTILQGWFAVEKSTI